MRTVPQHYQEKAHYYNFLHLTSFKVLFDLIIHIFKSMSTFLSCWAGLNCRPRPYHGRALPTELQQHNKTKERIFAVHMPSSYSIAFSKAAVYSSLAFVRYIELGTTIPYLSAFFNFNFYYIT